MEDLNTLSTVLRHYQEKPYTGKPLSYHLAGYRSLHVGKYRIIYEIDEKSREVILRTIGHRKHVYS